MPVAPLQIPGYAQPRDLDFTPLSQLGQVYQQRQQREKLADLGRGLASGALDYRQAAAQAADMGNIDATMKFLALDEARRKETLGQEASNQFLNAFRGGGQVPAAGSPTTARPAAARAPVEVSDIPIDGPSPLDPPSGQDRDAAIRTLIAEAGNQGPTGMNAVGSVIRNRAVAGNYGGQTAGAVVTSPNQFEPWNTQAGRDRMAAIDPNSPEYVAAGRALDAAYSGNDPTNGAVNFYAPKAQAALGRQAPSWDNGTGVDIGDHRFFGGASAPAAAAPYQVAQAGGGVAAPSQASAAQAPAAGPSIPVLLQAIANPNLPAGQKDIAKMYLQKAMKDMVPAERIKTLQGMRDNPDLFELEKQLAAARKPEVNVNTKGEGKFAEGMATAQAKRFNEMIETGVAAQRKMVDINSMREISTRLGSQGAAANVKEALGPYAEALNINIDGLSDIQAYSSIVQRLAPQQRAPGSGSTSDIEFKGFLKSLPTLAQNPAARDATLNTMEALTRDEMTRGEIASRLANEEITRTQAEKMLRELPDPMKAFAEWRKANPEVYGQALKASNAPAARPKMSNDDVAQSIANARAAIQTNPAAREAIIKRLRDNNIDPSGL